MTLAKEAEKDQSSESISSLPVLSGALIARCTRETEATRAKEQKRGRRKAAGEQGGLFRDVKQTIADSSLFLSKETDLSVSLSISL